MQIFLLLITVCICIVVSLNWTDVAETQKLGSETETREQTVKIEEPKEKLNASLAQIAKLTLVEHFNRDKTYSIKQFSEKFSLPENYLISSGLFVTFYKDGKTRACWGSVEPTHENLVKSTVFAAEDAINKEYRHKPIKRNEVDQLNVQVTVIRKAEPISSINQINPLHDGLMVQANGKGAVILPGEASDPHHQLVMARLKAGISKNQSCQLYRLNTDVYR